MEFIWHFQSFIHIMSHVNMEKIARHLSFHQLMRERFLDMMPILIAYNFNSFRSGSVLDVNEVDVRFLEANDFCCLLMRWISSNSSPPMKFRRKWEFHESWDIMEVTLSPCSTRMSQPIIGRSSHDSHLAIPINLMQSRVMNFKIPIYLLLCTSLPFHQTYLIVLPLFTPTTKETWP